MSKESDQLRRKVAELEKENERLAGALQQSEELFHKIFQASSNMMAIHTVKEGRFVDINESAASLGGFKREDVLGHTMAELGMVEDPSFREVVDQKIQQYGKVHNMEAKVRTQGGEMHTVLFSADPITVNDEPCILAVSVDITEREKKESALRWSEEKYRSLVENSLMGFVIIQDLRFVFCNNKFASMLGLSIEEALSLTPDRIMEMVCPDDQASAIKRREDELAGRPVEPHFEFRGIRKDGATIWMEVHTSLIEYNGKQAIQAICRDITKRKNAESALRESEERFRLIAATIDEIFWIFDTEKWVATYMSPAYDRIWGYPKERVVGSNEPFVDPVHPDDRERVLSVAERMRSGMPVDLEYRIIRPDGTVRHLWNRGYPVASKDGQVRQIVGVAQDVTQWRRAEEALEESREYLNRIINCIGDPIFVKDAEHRLILVNDAMCTFMGAPRDQLLGATFMPESVLAGLWEQEDEVLKTGREKVSEDVVPDGQGSPHTFMARKFLLTDKKGNKQIVAVLRDITEYKRLEAQFLQSQKMEAIGVLAGGVAHDFNNLLNVINGYTELMLDEIDKNNLLHKDLEQVRDAGQRAAKLTSQLLAFGRKQIMQPEILDLNEVIAGMTSMLRRMIGEDIEFISSSHPEPVLVNADPGKIQQVIMNLVVNARDAMPGGGRLTIETATQDFEEDYIRNHPVAKPGSYALLAISDNGTGMDPDTQARIFEPFFTTKDKQKGTGLGLSTVYGIVKQSNGFIWVYSEPGKGTTFKLYFPRQTSRKTEDPITRKLDPNLRGFETVLIAEDEPAVRALASRILRDRGYTVLEAAGGKEALRIAQEYPDAIQLVLTDVVMPGMGGKLLVSSLEEVRPGIKSLFISGYTDNAIVHQGILDSDVNFLQKPFSTEDLIRKVREVLNTKSAGK